MSTSPITPTDEAPTWRSKFGTDSLPTPPGSSHGRSHSRSKFGTDSLSNPSKFGVNSLPTPLTPPTSSHSDTPPAAPVSAPAPTEAPRRKHFGTSYARPAAIPSPSTAPAQPPTPPREPGAFSGKAKHFGISYKRSSFTAQPSPRYYEGLASSDVEAGSGSDDDDDVGRRVHGKRAKLSCSTCGVVERAGGALDLSGCGYCGSEFVVNLDAGAVRARDWREGQQETIKGVWND